MPRPLSDTCHARAPFLVSSLSALVLLLAAGAAGCVDAENEVVFDSSSAAADPTSGLTSGCNGFDPPPPGRLRGLVYSLPLETRQLPDFEALRPVGSLCMNALSVNERRGYPGFPGIRNRFEWFGVAFDGSFVVSEPGVYHFRLTSDDGSKLFLDAAPVIDNDGFHVTRAVEATVALTAGPHVIVVPYWQGPGPMDLQLEVAPPGEGYRVFQIDRPLGREASSP